MYPHHKRQVVGVADRLSDGASADPWSRWIAGVVFPLVPLVLGVWGVLTQHAYFLGGKPLRVIVYGGHPAIAVGVGTIAVAAFMHGHFFWSGSRRFYFVSELLKPLSALFVLGACGFIVVNEIVFR